MVWPPAARARSPIPGARRSPAWYRRQPGDRKGLWVGWWSRRRCFVSMQGPWAPNVQWLGLSPTYPVKLKLWKIWQRSACSNLFQRAILIYKSETKGSNEIDYLRVLSYGGTHVLKHKLHSTQVTWSTTKSIYSLLFIGDFSLKMSLCHNSAHWDTTNTLKRCIV